MRFAENLAVLALGAKYYHVLQFMFASPRRTTGRHAPSRDLFGFGMRNQIAQPPAELLPTLEETADSVETPTTHLVPLVHFLREYNTAGFSNPVSRSSAIVRLPPFLAVFCCRPTSRQHEQQITSADFADGVVTSAFAGHTRLGTALSGTVLRTLGAGFVKHRVSEGEICPLARTEPVRTGAATFASVDE